MINANRNLKRSEVCVSEAYMQRQNQRNYSLCLFTAVARSSAGCKQMQAVNKLLTGQQINAGCKQMQAVNKHRL